MTMAGKNGHTMDDRPVFVAGCTLVAVGLGCVAIQLLLAYPALLLVVVGTVFVIEGLRIQYCNGGLGRRLGQDWRQVLQEMSLLDFLADPALMTRLNHITVQVGTILAVRDLKRSEVQDVTARMDPEFRQALLRPGLGRFLPGPVQRMVIEEAEEEIGDDEAVDLLTNKRESRVAELERIGPALPPDVLDVAVKRKLALPLDQLKRRVVRLLRQQVLVRAGATATVALFGAAGLLASGWIASLQTFKDVKLPGRNVLAAWCAAGSMGVGTLTYWISSRMAMWELDNIHQVETDAPRRFLWPGQTMNFGPFLRRQTTRDFDIKDLKTE